MRRIDLSLPMGGQMPSGHAKSPSFRAFGEALGFLDKQAIRCFHRSRESYSNLNNRLSQALALSKEEVS